jgi:hypothetical protein
MYTELTCMRILYRDHLCLWKNSYDIEACCKNQRSRHLNFISSNLEKNPNTCHQKLGNEVGYTLKVSIQKGCLFCLNSWENYLIYSRELWHPIYF